MDELLADCVARTNRFNEYGGYDVIHKYVSKTKQAMYKTWTLLELGTNQRYSINNYDIGIFDSFDTVYYIVQKKYQYIII